MKSIEERLIASDPAAGAPYTSTNYDAMISRIVAVPYEKSATAWRGFKVRMAGSVAAASLLTALGITALNTAGNALPVLGFASASTHKATGFASASPSSTFMIARVNYQFNGADRFPTQGGVATSYALSAPSDPAATLSAIASVLQVDVAAPTTTDHGQSYTANGSRYSGWLVPYAGYDSWGVDSNAAQPATVASTQSPDQLRALAVSFAQKLGSFDVGAATIDATSDPAGPTNVTVPLLVSGENTGLDYVFSFAGDGTLLSAGGESFAIQPAGDYPLISPSAGVDQINAQFGIATGVFTTGGIASASSGGTGSSSGSVGSSTPPTVTPMTSASTTPTVVPPSTEPAPPNSTTGPVTSSPPSPPTGTIPPDSVPTTPTTTPPPTFVNLTDYSSQYGVYTLTNGTTMLLPVYVYDGTIEGDAGYQVSFRVVPIDPSYLDLSTVRNSAY